MTRTVYHARAALGNWYALHRIFLAFFPAIRHIPSARAGLYLLPRAADFFVEGVLHGESGPGYTLDLVRGFSICHDGIVRP